MITTQPQPDFICDTTTERDAIAYSSDGIRCFVRNEGKAYIRSNDTWVTSQPASVEGVGLLKITVGTSTPSSPSTGDLWIDAN